VAPAGHQPDGRSDRHHRRRRAAIRLWDATTGAAVGLLRGHEGPVLVLCYSPDGKRLASGSADRTIRLWDPEGAKPVAVLRGHERPVEWLAYGPDGRRLCSTDNVQNSINADFLTAALKELRKL
jgi:WD40 repeat protein